MLEVREYCGMGLFSVGEVGSLHSLATFLDRADADLFVRAKGMTAHFSGVDEVKAWQSRTWTEKELETLSAAFGTPVPPSGSISPQDKAVLDAVDPKIYKKPLGFSGNSHVEFDDFVFDMKERTEAVASVSDQSVEWNGRTVHLRGWEVVIDLGKEKEGRFVCGAFPVLSVFKIDEHRLRLHCEGGVYLLIDPVGESRVSDFVIEPYAPAEWTGEPIPQIVSM